MPQYITEVTADDLLRLLNLNIRAFDNALDDGEDAYNRWVAWRAQFATSADAATDLQGKGATWVTAAIIDSWASSFSGFNHLQLAATGTDQGPKDCYFDWNKVFN